MRELLELADISQGMVRSGRGAGARPGDWMLSVVESKNVDDDRLILHDLKEIGVVPGIRTERHLLRPFDVLVTARSRSVQSALVPPEVSRTVAGVTLLVVTPHDPGSGMGHYLWYYLTSSFGRVQLAKRTTPGVTLTSLSARNLGEVPVPVPKARTLDRLAELVEASEAAYASALEAAIQRRDVLRDALIGDLVYKQVQAR